MYPGDEIRTSCTYTSVNKNKTVYFGDGTNDEMCYGFLNYHPAQNIQYPHCTTWKSVEKCIRYVPEFKGMYDDCAWNNFMNFRDNSSAQYLNSLNESCYNMDQSCSIECSKEINRFQEHPCMKDDIGEFIRYRWIYFYSHSLPGKASDILWNINKGVCTQKFVLTPNSGNHNQIIGAVTWISVFVYSVFQYGMI